MEHTHSHSFQHLSHLYSALVPPVIGFVVALWWRPRRRRRVRLTRNRRLHLRRRRQPELHHKHILLRTPSDESRWAFATKCDRSARAVRIRQDGTIFNTWLRVDPRRAHGEHRVALVDKDCLYQQNGVRHHFNFFGGPKEKKRHACKHANTQTLRHSFQLNPEPRFAEQLAAV